MTICFLMGRGLYKLTHSAPYCWGGFVKKSLSKNAEKIVWIHFFYLEEIYLHVLHLSLIVKCSISCQTLSENHSVSVKCVLIMSAGHHLHISPESVFATRYHDDRGTTNKLTASAFKLKPDFQFAVLSPADMKMNADWWSARPAVFLLSCLHYGLNEWMNS